jgi:hypothetical protein
MPALLFRLSALAIRFLCPLVALALSDADTMGKYYLFISYFTFVVGVSALELAVPFSRKFLRCRGDRQRRLVFAGFMTNQIVVTAALAVPAGMLVASWAGVPAVLIPLFCLSLATEACVNEVGRFFWNIGEWRMPSLRDLVRACIFTTAIIGSVYLDNDVLTPVTFATITAGNLCIMAWEWKAWGTGSLRAELKPARLLKTVSIRVRRSLTASLPQFAHMQILGLQPLLERTLLEKSMGLAAVAAFSLFTSIMQSASGLLLVPKIAAVRKSILDIKTAADFLSTRRMTIALFAKISVISAVFATGSYMAFPVLGSILEKDLHISPLLASIACIASVSAIFSAAISPLLTNRGTAWKTNLLCVLALCPLIAYLTIPATTDITISSAITIAVVSATQIFVRLLFILRNTR